MLSTTLSTAALDKHPQSRERGITLDLGFSAFYMDLPPHLKGEWMPRNMAGANEQQPMNSEPMNSEPMNSEPMNSEPMNSEPMNSEPMNSEPMNSEPMNSEPMNGVPMVLCSGRYG